MLKCYGCFKISKKIDFPCIFCKDRFCSRICSINHLATHDIGVNNKQSRFITNGSIINIAQKNSSYFDWNNFDIEYENGKKLMIGQGAYGDVYRVVNKNDGKQFAVKKMDKVKILESGAKLDIIKREIQIHTSFDHPNIVRAQSFYEDSASFYLVF